MIKTTRGKLKGRVQRDLFFGAFYVRLFLQTDWNCTSSAPSVNTLTLLHGFKMSSAFNVCSQNEIAYKSFPYVAGYRVFSQPVGFAV